MVVTFQLWIKYPLKPRIDSVKNIIGRILTGTYLDLLDPFAKYVPKHIIINTREKWKKCMYALDVLMKNEAKHSEDITKLPRQKFYNDERRRLTCERQVGPQRLTRCANSVAERLKLLEPVSKDWHCLVSLSLV